MPIQGYQTTASSSGIVIIHQELALIPYLSIAENIFLGNERARGAASSTGTRRGRKRVA